MEDYEFDEFFDGRRDMYRECSYEEAHNRVWGSIAYAEEAGISPDKSFQLTQYMLEEDTDEVPLIEYEYGREGKHFLTCSSHLEASRYLPLLRKNLGEGNYDYIVNIGEPEDDDDDDFDEDYDDDYDDDETTNYDLPIDHLNMFDIVNAKNLAGPKFICKILQAAIHDIEDEAEFRRKYVDYILEHPEELLCRLPRNEISMLRYLKANPSKFKGVLSANVEGPLFLKIAGVADSYLNLNDEYCIRVADDFQKVALPLVAGVSMGDDVRLRYEVESVITGMTNLYGEVTLEDAKRAVMMDRGGFRSEAGRMIEMMKEQSLLLNFMYDIVDDSKTGLSAIADDNLSFISPYNLENPIELRKAIARNAKGGVSEQKLMPTQPFTDDEARRFKPDEIIAAGSGDVPTIPNERQQVFWHYLTHELGWNDYYARRICFELWYKANHIGNPADDDGLTIEEYFKDEALSFEGITKKEREKGMRMLSDYVAHIPRWALKGHAPADSQLNPEKSK